MLSRTHIRSTGRAREYAANGGAIGVHARLSLASSAEMDAEGPQAFAPRAANELADPAAPAAAGEEGPALPRFQVGVDAAGEPIYREVRISHN